MKKEKKTKTEKDMLGIDDIPFSDLIHTMREGFGIVDRNRILTYVNDRVIELFGYSRDEIIGRKATDFLEKENKKIYLDQMELRKKSIASPYELTWKKKNGENLYTLMSPSPIFGNGENFQGSFAVITDISELKKVNEALHSKNEKIRNIFEFSPDAIAVVATDGKITSHNKELVELHGFEEGTNLVGMSCFRFVSLKNHKKVRESMKHISDTGKSQKIELNLLRRDGKEIPCELSVGLVKDISGKPLSFVAIIRDVTEKKRDDQALNDSRKLIEVEVERKTQEIKKLNLQLQEYAKKLDLKLKRIDEKRINLTKKEKLAFYGLVRYPHLSVKELAEKIGLRKTTVNSIKNKLKSEGYYKTRYVPRFDIIGCDLFSFTYGKLGYIDTAGKGEIPLSFHEKMFEKVKSSPEKVYFVSSSQDFFSFVISKNLSDFKKSHDIYEEIMHKQKIRFEDHDVIHFPSDNSIFCNFFNFAGILAKRFELDVKYQKPAEPEHKAIVLSQMEKKLVYGLMKYPDATVAELAKRMVVSVPTICKLRKRLIDNGVLKVVNFPDFWKIGMDLLVFSRYRQTIPSGEDEGHPHKATNPNVFFSISTKTDRIVISACKDYAEAQNNFNHCKRCISENMLGRPVHIIIPFGDINFFKLDFIQLAAKLLGFDNQKV